MFNYALQLILRRKVRTFLTSLGVTISVILLSFIIFGMQDLNTLLTSEFSSRFKPNEIIVSNQSFNMIPSMGDTSEVTDVETTKKKAILNDEFTSKLSQVDGVENVKGYVMISGFEVSIEGYDKAYDGAFGSGLNSGSKDTLLGKFVEGDAELIAGKIYLSQFIVDYYKSTPSELIGKKVTLKPSAGSIFSSKAKSMIDKEFSFVVSGIFDPGQDRNDFTITLNDSVSIMSELGGFSSPSEYIEKIGYDQLILTVVEEKVADIKKVITDEYAVSLITADDLISFLEDITSALTFALVFFGLVSSVVASIGIINTMIMSIYEQTREIGILKAIGSSNIQVLSIFLIQSGMIGFLGGILGLGTVYLSMIILDPFIVTALKDIGFDTERFFHYDISVSIIIVLASIFVGIIAGIYPSMKAANLDPVKALRYE